MGCRSRVGEEFRTFAHGVCKDDKDMLHVLENKREVSAAELSLLLDIFLRLRNCTSKQRRARHKKEEKKTSCRSN